MKHDEQNRILHDIQCLRAIAVFSYTLLCLQFVSGVKKVYNKISGWDWWWFPQNPNALASLIKIRLVSSSLLTYTDFTHAFRPNAAHDQAQTATNFLCVLNDMITNLYIRCSSFCRIYSGSLYNRPTKLF